MTLHVFGIRHHGPGCARALRAALEELRPDVVLVEGPPEAESSLPLMLNPDMVPPVALLLYVPEEPHRAVYYPFVEFSPEWQALRYALERQIPVRFIDLPMAMKLASVEEDDDGETLRDDPIGMLAEAAGYTDREMWWEHQIEQRQNAAGLFEAILEAMREVRGGVVWASGPPSGAEEAGRRPTLHEEAREASMRSGIRAAMREGFERIAVICGAWHAPVLDPGTTTAKHDQELLARCSVGLRAAHTTPRRLKIACTWIPWSYSRLAWRSGYGAGVSSPSWYHHLWTAPDHAATRWVAGAAQLLRSQDLDAASANVIESVRLADTLAALRDLPMPGLGELNDAIGAVLCRGEEAPMQLIREQLEIGEAMGRVPADTPSLPLQRDVEAKQKKLRLKPTTEIKRLELDLRNENDRARSRFLHQLLLLGIAWGTPQSINVRTSATFHEHWQLQWQVEFPLRIIEANVWGNDTEAAASGLVSSRAAASTDLAELTTLLRQSVLADLPAAIERVIDCVQSQAAVAAEVMQLMNAMPPVAQVARYGDVRGTAPQRLLPVLDGIFERIVVGLPGACSSLDDEAAAAALVSIGGVHDSVFLLDGSGGAGFQPGSEGGRDGHTTREWLELLDRLSTDRAVHGLVRGWCCRTLADQHVIEPEELERRASLELSRGAPVSEAAAWLEGLLRGSAMLLIHDDDVLRVIDQWLMTLSDETFTETLPLIRRSFARFEPPERRVLAEKLSRGTASVVRVREAANLDADRAARVLPTLAHILGGSDA